MAGLGWRRGDHVAAGKSRTAVRVVDGIHGEVKLSSDVHVGLVVYNLRWMRQGKLIDGNVDALRGQLLLHLLLLMQQIL